jgi:hypothetical protein
MAQKLKNETTTSRKETITPKRAERSLFVVLLFDPLNRVGILFLGFLSLSVGLLRLGV